MLIVSAAHKNVSAHRIHAGHSSRLLLDMIRCCRRTDRRSTVPPTAPIAYPLAAPPLARGIADRLIDEAVASSTFRLGIALLLRDFFPSGLACRTNRIAGKRTTAKAGMR